MSLRFELCACLMHGRLIGAPGTVPFEIGSREMAKAMFAEAERNGVFAPGGRAGADASVAASMMPIKDEWIEDGLRQRITLWNVAAGTVSDPDAFGRTDFHAYHDLVDGFGRDDTAA